MNFKRRVGRLEDAFRVGEPTRIRVVISSVWKDVGLTRATCRRTLGNGLLTEIVDLKGGSSNFITEEELQRFVDSFPVVDQHGREVAPPWSGARGRL